MDSHAAPLRNPSRDHNRFNSMAERSRGACGVLPHPDVAGKSLA